MTDREYFMSSLKRQEKIDRISQSIMQSSKNDLLLHLSFLASSINQLETKEAGVETIATNGTIIGYNPAFIIERYKRAGEHITRTYLHCFLHCVFKHIYVDPFIEKPFWDLACDIATENIINELDLRTTQLENIEKQRDFIHSLKDDLTLLTAEKIYRYLLDSDLSLQKIREIRKLFIRDDHSVWYETGQDFKTCSDPMADGSNHRPQNGSDTKDDSDKQSKTNDGLGAPDPASKKIWEKAAFSIKTDLETFSKRHGKDGGFLVQNIKAVTREKYDYSTFLKRFAVMGEVMQVNDEEFDYIFYTYGLKMYGKMPLIEPLEYKEVKRIKEFVIAIDTSGSVQGHIVQKFIRKTYNILKQTESFFTKINLYIIQCDAEIQDVVKITDQDEFDQYLKTMCLKGFGGTDFRPVFSYVDRLKKAGELKRLKGLIYFTDGFGDYPSKKPDYETAFVFLKEDYVNPVVPSWAIKLVLESEDVEKY